MVSWLDVVPRLSPAGDFFRVSCCEVAAHLSIGLKDPKSPFGEGMSWNPGVQVLAGNEGGGITDAVTALHHPVELLVSV